MKPNSIKRKRAFTLTELLIVVIVIGVLAAVTLPKFNRVIENRKVTEAEEMMAAVRTEQERRCALDQNYTQQFANLADVIASSSTKNYTYNLTDPALKGQGIAAASTSGGYTLKMLSYQDGGICSAFADENRWFVCVPGRCCPGSFYRLSEEAEQYAKITFIC